MKNNNPRIVKITRDETKSYHPAVGYTNIVELTNNTTHAAIEYWHEGKCCRCGRLLTTPESIDAGIGPECIKRRNK